MPKGIYDRTGPVKARPRRARHVVPILQPDQPPAEPRLIDLGLAADLFNMQCTVDEVRALLKTTHHSLDAAICTHTGMTLDEFVKEHQTGGLASLRRAQWKTALDGNVTMQIWLGKQYLGQRDKSKEEIDQELAAKNKLLFSIKEERQELESKTIEQLQEIYKERMGYAHKHRK